MTGHPMFRTSASLFFLAAGYGQQVANDGIAAAQASCKQVELRLRLAETIRTPEASSTTGAPADDLRAASEACTRFKSALAAEDAAAARKAAVELLRLNPASAPVSPQERFVGEEAAAATQTGLRRFYALANLAKAAFDAGEFAKAQSYANELLQMAPAYPKDWNYGNAIYFGYFVLGRVALQQGNISLAEQYLLNSASTPGSPQLNSFGPNTTLAKELLEKGRTTAVLQYFALCANFWKLRGTRLDDWAKTVRAGGIPDFRANLRY